jgi:hypothetical protein
MSSIPSDLELCQACAASYGPGTPYFQPPGFTDRLFLTETADYATLIPEGTYNAPGWVGDFLALGVREHPTTSAAGLSFIHADFYEAALRLLPAVQAVAARKPIALGGHSRGAALAAMLAALLIQQNIIPVKLALYAPPRVGAADFIALVTSALGVVPAYKFGDDPVPEVPFTLEPDFPYEQFSLTKIGAALPIAIECHKITNYVAGVQALGIST